MRKITLTVLILLVCGCSSNAILDFRIKAIPGEGVDAETARRIVLSRALEVQNQSGDVVLKVYRRNQEEKEQCFANKFYSKALGEYCGADFSIATPYIKHKGYSAYNVLEECHEGHCKYRFCYVDQGIEE